MMTLTDPQRRTLLDAADVLIPATATMPALRDADPDGQWLDAACTARGDLLDELHKVLEDLPGEAGLAHHLRRLHDDDRHRFDVLATFVAGTYYLIPAVRELIGYPGQQRRPAPVDLAADELGDEIFEAAMAYPGSYRDTPR